MANPANAFSPEAPQRGLRKAYDPPLFIGDDLQQLRQNFLYRVLLEDDV
jgi:hypothetical protein